MSVVFVFFPDDGKISVIDIVELPVPEDGVHFIDMPLLDVIRMWIRQPEEPLGEMPYHRVLMQEFLIVEPLGQYLSPRCGPDQRALVGEDQLLSLDPDPGLFEQPGLA